jgi:hypothetical protein
MPCVPSAGGSGPKPFCHKPGTTRPFRNSPTPSGNCYSPRSPRQREPLESASVEPQKSSKAMCVKYGLTSETPRAAATPGLQVRDANTVADSPGRHCVADSDHISHHLVPEYAREMSRQFSACLLDIGVTDAAGPEFPPAPELEEGAARQRLATAIAQLSPAPPPPACVTLLGSSHVPLSVEFPQQFVACIVCLRRTSCERRTGPGKSTPAAVWVARRQRSVTHGPAL